MSKNDSSGFIEHCKRSRVRKPPGGDTNDIFRLEERQRVQKDRLHVYEDVNEKIKGDETLRKHRESEDALAPKENRMRNLRRSLSDCQVSDVNWRSPPLATGKENIVIYKDLAASRQTVKNPDYAPTEGADDEEDDECLEAEKSLARNPITGEGLNPARKQEDVASGTSAEQPSQDEAQKKPRRPCIRVREPPGGKSSIVF